MAPDFVVEPTWQSIDGVRVSADIHLDQDRHRWYVTLMLSLPPDQTTVKAEDVDACLEDDHGTGLVVVQRPTGHLVALSEEMRSAVDAPFQFQTSGGTLARLVAAYCGQSVEFRIVHRPQGSSGRGQAR